MHAQDQIAAITTNIIAADAERTSLLAKLIDDPTPELHVEVTAVEDDIDTYKRALVRLKDAAAEQARWQALPKAAGA
jgi:hypothetical protein